MKILILDDSAEFVSTSRDVISEAIPGCEIVHVETCNEALGQTAMNNFNLIIVDFQLGREYGTDCIKDLQALQPIAKFVLWSTEEKTPKRVMEAKHISGVTFFKKGGHTRDQFISFFRQFA